MMIPFRGTNLSLTHPSREWFNFWYSQVRIAIERSFSILVQRFGIFWQALKYDLNKSIELVHACCRLHNFCINNNLPVISSRHVPLEVAVVEANGTLVDPHWRSSLH
jgi:DDE superfamily endonuclease